MLLASHAHARRACWLAFEITHVYTGGVLAVKLIEVFLKLVILESRGKARTIKKYLGKGWMVDACNGHVQDLPSGEEN